MRKTWIELVAFLVLLLVAVPARGEDKIDRTNCFSRGLRPTGITVSPYYSQTAGDRPLLGYNVSLSNVGLSWNCIETEIEVGSGNSNHGRAGVFYFLGGGGRWYPVGHFRSAKGLVLGVYGNGAFSFGLEALEGSCCGGRESIFQGRLGGGIEAGWSVRNGEFLLFGEASVQRSHIWSDGLPVTLDRDDTVPRWSVGIRVRGFILDTSK